MPATYEADMYYRFSPFAKKLDRNQWGHEPLRAEPVLWVLDAVASYVPTLAKRKGVDYFLIVSVEVNPDKTALFTVKQEEHDRQGNHHYKTLIRQEIEYTDLKESLTFWAINESAGAYDPACQTVVLLPEEY